jgi:hypothetical protein
VSTVRAQNNTGPEEPSLLPADASRRNDLIELGVFLLLIVPSMALSFLAGAQGEPPFPVVASATIARDLGLVALIFFFLYRNGERLATLGWTARHGT